MPRYEFSEGTSNKFWEIELKGKSFTTTYGKIGSGGQTTIKEFKSDADAKKEYDKIIAEKTKKGYELVGGAGAAADDDDDDDVEHDDDDAKPAKSAKSAKPAAAAAKTAKAPTGGARRFEFVEGTSSKFWEISMEGSSVTTRYGRIGSDGQTTTKDFDSKVEAFKEYDKLVAEKTKKGYEEKGGDDGGGGGGASGDARNSDLEKAIVADPYDQDAYAVLGDWLQAQGDPRGELIALHIAGKDKPAKALIDKQADYFLGPLAEHQRTYDPGLGNNCASNRYNPDKLSDKEFVKLNEQAFHWKNGFIHWARLSHDHYALDYGPEELKGFKGSLAEILELLLRHPSGRFLAELTLGFNNDPNESDLQDLLDILAKKAPKTLRKIVIGDNVDQISWFHVGNLGKVWKAVPGLVSIDIIAGEFALGTIEAPNLRHATFKTGGLSKASTKSIASASWPKIEQLEVYFGDDNYGGDATVKDVQPLLDRTDLKSLKRLGLMNSQYSLTEPLMHALPNAKIIKQLTHLDLSQGCMTDELAGVLAAHKNAFAHLDTLDVSENYLTKKGVASLKGLAKNVISKEQRDDDDPEYRNPSIAE
jgi:uncharacterized protein (TIGR02996 family)